ncbi:MAG: nucleotidyltransferase family protein [Bacillota bacterium]
MKAIILAAGYATRLYPLTLYQPKALLKVADKPILDYLVNELELIEDINEILIVSNHKFYQAFHIWKDTRKTTKAIKIIDDGTTCDEGKLGAIGDIQYVIEKEAIEEDLFVAAGDNIFTFSLKSFVHFFKLKQKDCLLVMPMEWHELKRMGVVEVDSVNRVTLFEEKPQNPRSALGVFALYIYRKDTVPLFKQYLQQGNRPDAPGYFPEWLCKRKEVYAYFTEGQCFDIGTVESYKAAQEAFKIMK